MTDKAFSVVICKNDISFRSMLNVRNATVAVCRLSYLHFEIF